MLNYNVLVIGSNGFIGQNLIKKLSESNSTFNIFGLSRSLYQSDLKFSLLVKDWRDLSVLELTNYDFVIFASRIPLQDRSQNIKDSDIQYFINDYKELCHKFTLSRSKSFGKFVHFSSHNYTSNSPSERSRYFEIKERVSLVTRDLIARSNLIEMVLPNIFGFSTIVKSSNGIINNLIFNAFSNTTTHIFGDIFVPKDYLHINILTSCINDIITSGGHDFDDRVTLRGNNIYNNIEIASILNEILIKFYGVIPKISLHHGSLTLSEKTSISFSFKQELRETIDEYREYLALT